MCPVVGYLHLMTYGLAHGPGQTRVITLGDLFAQGSGSSSGKGVPTTGIELAISDDELIVVSDTTCRANHSTIALVEWLARQVVSDTTIR